VLEDRFPFFRNDELVIIGQLVWDALTWRDSTSGADKPLLAEEWKRAGETILELTSVLAAFTLTNVATDRDGGIAGEGATSADVDATQGRYGFDRVDGEPPMPCLMRVAWGTDKTQYRHSPGCDSSN